MLYQSAKTANAINDMRLDPNGPAPGGKVGYIRHADGRVVQVRFKRMALWLHCQSVPDALTPKRINNITVSKSGRSPGVSRGIHGPWMGWTTEAEYRARLSSVVKTEGGE